MKRRITGICVGTLVLGGYLVFAMTKADLTEVVLARLQFEGSEAFDVFLRGSPLSGHFDVADPPVGARNKNIGLARYEGLTVQIPIPDGADATKSLLLWMQRNETQFAPRNGVLTILGADGKEVSVLGLENAWPSKITQPRVTRVGFRGRVVAECVIQADRVKFVTAPR